jgi:hypothetical protein
MREILLIVVSGIVAAAIGFVAFTYSDPGEGVPVVQPATGLY